jgi:hypothetical protein
VFASVTQIFNCRGSGFWHYARRYGLSGKVLGDRLVALSDDPLVRGDGRKRPGPRGPGTTLRSLPGSDSGYLTRFIPNQHDREDLLQGFLAHLNRPTTLSRIDRELGSFRSFIKKSLSNYVLGQRETAEAKKRGGGSLTVSLDDRDNGVAERMPSEGLSPDQAFDRHWALNVVALASKRLQSELQAAGRGELWEGLLPMLYRDLDRARYRELSRSLGMSEEALRGPA